MQQIKERHQRRRADMPPIGKPIAAIARRTEDKEPADGQHQPQDHRDDAGVDRALAALAPHRGQMPHHKTQHQRDQYQTDPRMRQHHALVKFRQRNIGDGEIAKVEHVGEAIGQQIEDIGDHKNP